MSTLDVPPIPRSNSTTSTVADDRGDLSKKSSPVSNSITPNATYVDLAAKKELDVDSATLSGEAPGKTEGAGAAEPNVLADMSPGRKSILLLAFCLSMFIDAAGVSATFLMTAPIAKDLNISLGNSAWILATYTLAFAATLLFAGRLADLYSPSIVYSIGFLGLGVMNLIISFMDNEYAFYVLRAVNALLAVLTIPSSINMIIQMYPDSNEQAKKLALFGMSGALANTLALVLAGVFMLASWRWYFRFIAILVIPFSVGAWFLLPRTQPVAADMPGAEKWKRMDLGGVFLLMVILVLFILGFTQAEVKGWDSAIFIAPFVISVALLPVFLYYEHRLPKGYSLLPHDIWNYPNIFPLILQASAIFMWFATFQLRAATYFQDVLGDTPILAAVKMLPMGITALIVGVATQPFPWLVTRPRYVQPVAAALCFAGSMLLAFSGGGHGKDYWRYIFPGEIIGTAGGMIVFIGMNTAIIQSFPREFAGVGGSFANVIFQVGGVIGIAIQAGLLSTGDGTIEDWTGSRNGYIFTSVYVLFTGLVFVAWYRQHKMPDLGQVVAV